MKHPSTPPSHQKTQARRRIAAIGSIRHTPTGRTVTTAITEAGVSGRITRVGGSR